MGSIGITGKFMTGDAYGKLITESFMAQARSGYNWYTGDIGTINKFNKCREIELNGKIGYHLQDFIKNHPQYKTKEEIITNYLMEKEQPREKGELVYIVDYTTICGYEIVTAGGKQEIDIRQLPELWIEHLEPSKKGYKAFELTAYVWDKNVARNNKEFTTLKEAEEKLSKDMVYYRQTYFVIKNDRSKAYMLFPNIKMVKTTTRKSDRDNYTMRVDKVYPVYYVGIAIC